MTPEEFMPREFVDGEVTNPLGLNSWPVADDDTSAERVAEVNK